MWKFCSFIFSEYLSGEISVDVTKRRLHSLRWLLKWKHRKLDVDSDRRLNKDELMRVKSELNLINKECSLSIIFSCNANKDNYITTPEWIACLAFQSKSKTLPNSIKLQGKTKYDTYYSLRKLISLLNRKRFCFYIYFMTND